MGPKTRQQLIATPQTPKKKQQPITAYATPVSKTPKKRQAAELDLPQDWDSSDDDNDEAQQVTRGSQPSSPSKRAAQRIKLAKAPPPLTEDEREKLHQFDLDMKFGPNIGISRLERWERAKKFDLEPPPDILAILNVEGREEWKEVQESIWRDL